MEVEGVERVGTGQMSQSHRVVFTAPDGAGTVVVKLASADADSRRTGVGMGAYRREITFYRDLAQRLGGSVPRCHHAAYDDGEGWFTLVLEDVADGVVGDQVAGCTVEEAERAIDALARLHAPVLGDAHVGAREELNLPNPLDQALATALLSGFLERYDGQIADEHVDVLRRFVAVLDAWAADTRPPLGLVHGDFRLDNLLFTPDGCKVVDWQTLSWGPAAHDLAYFLAGALEPEDRRAHEERLVRRYRDGLVAAGAEAPGWELLWDEYRRLTFSGLLMAIVAAMVVERTERGDAMFTTWVRRNAQQVLDLDALSLLPSPDAARPSPLRPAASDEGTHPPGGDEVWNESWYFDAISHDGTLGVYHRLGRVPNQGAAMLTTAIVGPGRRSVLLVDTTLPLPAPDDPLQRVERDGLLVEQRCEAPLERFTVRVRGTAAAHDDPAAPLRGEPGEPVAIELEATWDTAGVPFQWRQSTRYEIPCTVTGTVRVGDEELAFSGVGQRDHSWGARDWFATDWMWNALHLDDGTHTHAVGIPRMPGYGIGYVQRDGAIEEIAGLGLEIEGRDDGLVSRTRTRSGDLALDIEPVAFGAIRLEAPDGRVSFFPRAMARVRADDGRAGVGWIEWNRNQPHVESGG